MLKITSEEQLLNAEVRKKLIECFDQGENARRKAEAFKGYECLKDKTSNYVLKDLLNLFSAETVREMQYSISNISILRKVIDKLAKVYTNGATREVPKNKKATKNVQSLAELLKVNVAMKKANRYFRTFKNTLVYVRPQVTDENTMTCELEIKPPFNYDVVENPQNFKEPLAIILSDYRPSRPSLYYLGDTGRAGREGAVKLAEPSQIGAGESATSGTNTLVRAYSGGKSTGGADKDDREFIWWTKNYHFTTDCHGEIIARPFDGDGLDSIKNPIEEMPFVNLAGDQDSCFWAEGGKDLIDSGVKINTMISNADHIGVNQGYGQLFMTGKNLPRSITTGPNRCIQIEHDKEDPTPVIGYMQANPPLDALKSQIEMAVALMLSTNNLSTSGIAVSLSGGRDFASGVALLIDKSESTEDINDQAQIFIDAEPEIWSLIADWQEFFKNANVIDESFGQYPIKPEEVEQMTLSFPKSQVIQSESEKLDNLAKRKDLGINREVELIMLDNPGMSEDDAQAKLDQINAERQKRAADMAQTMGANADPNAQDVGASSDSQDQGGAMPPVKKNESMAPGAGASAPKAQ